MSDVTKTLAEIVRCRKLIATNPADYPPQTAAGFAIAARQAKDSLPLIEREYVQAIQARSVTVVLVGIEEDAARFTALAAEEGIELTSNVNDLYGEIADRIIPSMGQHREWTPHQHSLAIQYSLSKAVDLGFREQTYDSNLPFNSMVCPTRADVVNCVRNTVRARLGDDLGRVYLRECLTARAVDLALLPTQPIGVLIRGAATVDEAHELLKAWPSISSVEVLARAPATADEVVGVFRSLMVPKASPPAPIVPPAESVVTPEPIALAPEIVSTPKSNPPEGKKSNGKQK